VSQSMSDEELEIQRRGYDEALASEAVFKALSSGMLGRMALTYVEWAGQQKVVIDWRLIETREDLDDFATDLIITYNPGMRRTSVSGAIDLAIGLIETNEFEGLRRVIDISGDGPNNAGRPVTQARDLALSRAITINGLPLLTRDGDLDEWYLPGLDRYFRDCVIGGPGSFLLPVTDWPSFGLSVRRKLVLEIANLAPTDTPAPERLFLAQASSTYQTDCLIGEKIWAERQRGRSPTRP